MVVLLHRPARAVARLLCCRGGLILMSWSARLPPIRWGLAARPCGGPRGAARTLSGAGLCPRACAAWPSRRPAGEGVGSRYPARAQSPRTGGAPRGIRAQLASTGGASSGPSRPPRPPAGARSGKPASTSPVCTATRRARCSPTRRCSRTTTSAAPAYTRANRTPTCGLSPKHSPPRSAWPTYPARRASAIRAYPSELHVRLFGLQKYWSHALHPGPGDRG